MMSSTSAVSMPVRSAIARNTAAPKLLRMDPRQCALAGLANASRRPACIDDQRVNHGVFLGKCWLAAFATGPGAKSFRAGLPTAHAGLRFPVVASAMPNNSAVREIADADKRGRVNQS